MYVYIERAMLTVKQLQSRLQDRCFDSQSVTRSVLQQITTFHISRPICIKGIIIGPIVVPFNGSRLACPPDLPYVIFQKLQQCSDAYSDQRRMATANAHISQTFTHIHACVRISAILNTYH